MNEKTYDLDKIEAAAKAAPKDFRPPRETWDYIYLLDPNAMLAMCADIRRYEKALKQIEVHVDPSCETCMATEKTVRCALAGDSDEQG